MSASETNPYLKPVFQRGPEYWEDFDFASLTPLEKAQFHEALEAFEEAEDARIAEASAAAEIDSEGQGGFWIAARQIC